MIEEARGGLDLIGVLIRGQVEIVEGDEARALNRTIHLRYVTEAGLRQEPVAAYLGAGDDITLRIHMDEVKSWNLRAGAAAGSLRDSGQFHSLDS